jgi:hypothetical protein
LLGKLLEYDDEITQKVCYLERLVRGRFGLMFDVIAAFEESQLVDIEDWLLGEVATKSLGLKLI